MATSTQINAITALYVGYFDRAPDPAGLQFWIDQLDNGREYNTIAADFAASPEAVALYPYLTTPDVSSPASFVTNIYANLFGRTPDQEGLDFWTGVLEDGSVSVADMIEAIIMGARDDAAAGTSDKTVLDNKVEVGLDFATSAAEVPGFEFDAAAKAAAVAAVNGVTEDEATVEAAKEATDAFVSGDSNPGTGDNLTLTDAIGEQVVGSAGNDAFTGVAGNGTNGTLQFGDQVDGGAGMDTLNLFGTTGADGLPAGVEISNVEVVNIFDGALGSTGGVVDEIDATDFGAAAEQIWQVETAGDIKNLADGQAAGYRNTNFNAKVVFEGENGTVALDKVTSGNQFEVVGEDLTTLNVAGSVKPAAPGVAGTIVLNATLAGGVDASLETVNLAITSDANIQTTGAGFAEVTDLNAGASTGDLSIDGTTATAGELALENVTLGSGDDMVTYNLASFSADEVSVDMGAGDDTVQIVADPVASTEETAFTLTGGAGTDRFDIDALANIIDADDLEASLVTVADFDTDEDVLEVGSTSIGNYDEMANDEAAAILAADSLEDALDLAATYINNTGDFTVFDFGGDAYVYSDAGTGTEFADGDGLVKLTGVSVADLDSTAFVTV
ncbi:DUF4214 domain-containing protein [Sulfitobacter sp. TB366]|uniref:DUF4214 domain-containing protein n=1 Tax=Sulfitobacter sp. TB366 TaxID=3368580 RepID=UPI00374707C9